MIWDRSAFAQAQLASVTCVLMINTWPLHSPYSSSSVLFSVLWPHPGSLFAKDLIKRAFIYPTSTAQPVASHYQTTNHPRRLIRTSLMLTLTCCYLMWAIAYLAQLHPLEGTLAICVLFIIFYKSLIPDFDGIGSFVHI